MCRTKGECLYKLNSTKAEISKQEDLYKRLVAAANLVSDSNRDMLKLYGNVNSWNTSLNHLLGGFTWEGAQVEKVQGNGKDALNDYSAYQGVQADRFAAIEQKQTEVASFIDTLKNRRNNLQYQYDYWDQNHPH